MRQREGSGEGEREREEKMTGEGRVGSMERRDERRVS